MDAITLLKDDHKTVENLFKRFEKAGDRAFVEKRELVDRIIEELSKHAAIEEQLFYPVTRATGPETNGIALESLEEHHIVKWVLSELDDMDPENERFDAKVTVLMENVRHHVKEEEGTYFPMVRDELGRNSLGELGDALAEAKKTAPTHPHPTSPDTPPGNIVAGTVAGAVDQIRDTVTGVAEGSVDALGDLIARVTGSRKPKTRTTGGVGGRKKAKATRAAAADAIDDLVAATKKARDTGESVTKSAGRGAKKTGKAAEAGAKGTATTARKQVEKAAALTESRAKATVTTAKKAAKATAASAKGTATTAKKAAKATASSAKGTATTAKNAAASTTSAAKGTKTTAKRSASSAGSAAKGTRTTAAKGAKATKTAAKRTVSTAESSAKKAGRATKTTAKRGATTTGRTAKKAAKATKATAKRAAKR